jgi:hypothetical protein
MCSNSEERLAADITWTMIAQMASPSAPAPSERVPNVTSDRGTRVQTLGSSRAQRIEALFGHLPYMFVLVILNNSFEQVLVFAFHDGLFANLGVGPCDLGNEKIAEFHGASFQESEGLGETSGGQDNEFNFICQRLLKTPPFFFLYFRAKRVLVPAIGILA